jgi:membrane protein
MQSRQVIQPTNVPLMDPSVELKAVLAAPRSFWTWLCDELRWLVRVILSAADRFYWENGFSKAASLAYTTLLSLVPVTALIFGLLSTFRVAEIDDVRRFVFSQFVPSTQAVDEVLEQLQLLNEKYSSAGQGVQAAPAAQPGEPADSTSVNATAISFNVLAFAVLVITSVLLLNSIEATLNEVWQVYEPRSIANRVKIFSSMLLIGPVLAVSAYFFAKFSTQHLGSFGWWTSLSSIYNYLLQFLFDFGAFFALYFLVPKAPIRAASATFGAFVAAVLFGLAKTGFVVYVERYASYDAIYGAVAAIPIFLVWLYLAWTVVLFGAETSYQAQYLPRIGKGWKRSLLSVGDGTMLLALQSLLLIGRAFKEGRRMPNDWEIAEHLACSSAVLKPTLSALEKHGLIAHGDSGEMPLTLLRAPDKITLLELRNALYGSRQGLHFAAELGRLYAAFADRKLPATMTLDDLLTQESVLTDTAGTNTSK